MELLVDLNEMKHFFLDTYWGGIIFLSIGILKILHTVKYTKKDINSVLQPYTSGILAGIGFIALGIIIFYFKIK